MHLVCNVTIKVDVEQQNLRIFHSSPLQQSFPSYLAWSCLLPGWRWPLMARQMAAAAVLAELSALQPTRSVVQPSVQAIYCMPAFLTHPPVIHLTSPREMWAQIWLDSSIIPTQEEKKYETQEKLKDYTIWPYLVARVCTCLSVFIHAYAQSRCTSLISFISYWVLSIHVFIH